MSDRSAASVYFRWLARVLGLASANCLAGRLVQSLAVPIGYTSAIFPPAGIGLAALLLWGDALWPGVFLGSLCFDSYIAVSSGAAADVWSSLGLACSLAIGSTLQALLGARLIRRAVGFPTALASGRDATSFLILAGPVSCVVAATWAVATLAIATPTTWHQASYNWFTWWIGDTLGVLVFAPLLMVMAASPRLMWRSRWLTLAVPLCASGATAVAAFVYAHNREQESIEAHFQRRTDAISHIVREQLEDYVDVLQALGSFYDNSRDVERHEFRNFASRWFERYGAIKALEWAPRVLDQRREQFEQRARSEAGVEEDEALAADLQAFEIRERVESSSAAQLVTAKRRAEYFPVLFAEPYKGNEPVLGFDVASHLTRQKALLRARDTGQATGTSRISLVQQPGRHHGMLLAMPIYRRNMPTNNVQQRREYLQGFVLGVLDVGSVVNVALTKLEDEDFQLRILDISAPRTKQVIYEDTDSAAASVGPLPGSLNAGKFVNTVQYEMAGRQWELEFVPRPAFLSAQQSWAPWFVLAAGMLLTGLLGGFLLVITGHAAAVARVVDEQTAELHQANNSLDQYAKELVRSNRDLEQFAYVASHDLQEPLRAVIGFCQLLERHSLDKLDAKSQEYIAEIVNGARRMQALIRDMLQFSRVGTADQALQPVDCNVVLDEVCRCLGSAIEENDAQVHYGSLPTVTADSSQLAQLFQNLIGNALKYRGQQAPQIYIDAVSRDDHWLFSVRDNGIGIDQKFRERVFLIFQRLHTREQYPGTGLGLAICKRIVERHGGDIWVQSQPGEGCTFYFTVPINTSLSQSPAPDMETVPS